LPVQGARRDLLIGDLAEVVDRDLERWHEALEDRLRARVAGEQLVEVPRGSPAPFVVGEHYGQDGRQRWRRDLVLAQPGVPDPQHVAEHAEGHQGVLRALVLEQHEDEDGGLDIRAANREQQVRVSVVLLAVLDDPGLEPQGHPIEQFHDRQWQDRHELCGRLGLVAERLLEEPVVRSIAGAGHDERRGYHREGDIHRTALR
jgi:hypothetical protein